MPNNLPIYSRVGDISATGVGTNPTMSQLVTAAVNDYTGIGAYSLIFTADATNGGYVQRIRLKAGGTNVATVARFFINNGAAQGTATNNTFYGEISLPATTASATSATVEIDYPLGFALNPGFKIYFGIATTVVGGWAATVIGGKY